MTTWHQAQALKRAYNLSIQSRTPFIHPWGVPGKHVLLSDPHGQPAVGHGTFDSYQQAAEFASTNKVPSPLIISTPASHAATKPDQAADAIPAAPAKAAAKEPELVTKKARAGKSSEPVPLYATIASTGNVFSVHFKGTDSIGNMCTSGHSLATLEKCRGIPLVDFRTLRSDCYSKIGSFTVKECESTSIRHFWGRYLPLSEALAEYASWGATITTTDALLDAEAELQGKVQPLQQRASAKDPCGLSHAPSARRHMKVRPRQLSCRREHFPLESTHHWLLAKPELPAAASIAHHEQYQPENRSFDRPRPARV